MKYYKRIIIGSSDEYYKVHDDQLYYYSKIFNEWVQAQGVKRYIEGFNMKEMTEEELFLLEL